MEPIFITANNDSIFAAYHPPINGTVNSRAVLICYPVFHEYIRSHRGMNFLAKKLSQDGHHVMRFDYLGTGDSSGESSSVGLDDWSRSIGLAIKELQDISGINKISIVGIRYASHIISISQLINIDKLILIDPVESGETFISNLQLMHAGMLSDPDRFQFPRNNVTSDEGVEILGYGINSKCFENIKSSVHQGYANVNEVFCISSDSDYKCIENNNDKINVEYFDVNYSWNNLDEIEDAIMPYTILNRTREILK